MSTDQRFESAVQLAASGSIDITRDGGLVSLRTGASHTRRLQWAVRVVSTIIAVGLVCLAWFTDRTLLPVGIAFAIAAMAAAVAVPKLVQQRELLAIDTDLGKVIFSQSNRTIDIADIASIDGVYETQGWDGRNVLYFVDVNRKRLVGVVLASNEELIAQACCEALTRLLNVPSSYTNQYDTTARFAPA